MSLGTAPSFLILGRGKNPNSVRWSVQDRMLFLAVQQLEEEKCPNCGTPYWWGHSAHEAIEYAIEFSQCIACADLAHRTKDIELDYGESAHVRPVDSEGGMDGLPSRVEAMAKVRPPLHNVPDE